MVGEQVMTQTVSVSQARQKLGELINQVYKQRLRIVVEKSGIPVAALVSPADLERWLQQEQTEESTTQAQASKEVAAVRNELLSTSSPTKEELAHRQALVAKVLAHAEKRVISPLTTADLVHQARAEREEAYERWSH
jgi:prevent-host-death family protein